MNVKQRDLQGIQTFDVAMLTTQLTGAVKRPVRYSGLLGVTLHTANLAVLRRLDALVPSCIQNYEQVSMQLWQVVSVPMEIRAPTGLPI